MLSRYALPRMVMVDDETAAVFANMADPRQYIEY